MRNASDATSATIPPQSRRKTRRLRLIQRAPGPEAPDSRDRAGAQRGMLILLLGGAAFWAAVTAVVVYLLR